ncbi:MAG TPA: extracellular solute-binding protein [Firmicutes bacterium]|nr:extracellular solute-binding protein [Bacillota bacterium]
MRGVLSGLLVLVVASGVGLGSQAASPAALSSKPDRPLIFVVHGRPELFEEYRKLFNEYEKETGIAVDMVTVDSAAAKWQKILPMLAGGVAPDVVAGVSVEFVGYAMTGLLRPLNDLIAETKTDLGQLIPVLVKELSWQGKQYIIPYGVSMMTMYYNVNMYSEAGLPPPPRGGSSVRTGIVG